MFTSKQRTSELAGGDVEPLITITRVLAWVEDVREQYQREEDQAILQLRMDKATVALAGKEACQRLKNDLTMRYDMDRNMLRVTASKGRR